MISILDERASLLCPEFLRATTTQCFSEVIKVAFHIQVSAGCEHAVLFRSDGTTVASEDNDDCKRKCYLWMTGFCMWCSDKVKVDNATFHPLIVGLATPRFLRVTCLQCYSDVMAVLHSAKGAMAAVARDSY